jgi:hypothetical protein
MSLNCRSSQGVQDFGAAGNVVYYQVSAFASAASGAERKCVSRLLERQ